MVAKTLPPRSRVGLSLTEISTQLAFKRNASISFVLFLVALALARHTELLDLPVARLVNGFVNKSATLDGLMYAFDDYFTFSGAVLVAVIWFCWFDTTELEVRARLLTATFMTIAGGGVSRVFQHRLPTHPRPYFDAALDFHAPSTLPGAPYNTWNSFPSDHAAMFAGLVVSIYVVRPRLGKMVAAWLIVVESSRIYMGAHYPSDLIGGAALAATLVWLSQSPLLLPLGRKVARWERVSPSLFYMSAAFFSYQIATLFADIRGLGGMIASGPR